ncbi:hypothetical protein [Nocardia sp. NPDC057030]|uniref:hypothetical protein n=1 Tax=unclassified Nocardia TaxID=2637762 RepID=UPI003633BDD8
MTKLFDNGTDGENSDKPGLGRKLWNLATSARVWTVIGGIAAVVAVVTSTAVSCMQGTSAGTGTIETPASDPEMKYWGSVIASGTDWWGMKFADWSEATQDRADLALHMQLGVSALHGVAFARAADPSFSSCWNAVYGTTRLMLDEIPSGSTVCVRTQAQRVGVVRFTWTKEPAGYPRSIEVSGIIWEPHK